MAKKFYGKAEKRGLGNRPNGMVEGMSAKFPQGLVWSNWPVPSYEDAYASDDTIRGIDEQRRGDLNSKGARPRKI